MISDKHFGRFLLCSILLLYVLAAQINCKSKVSSPEFSGRMIKLPRHVYLPNSEASVPSNGKIPGFSKFLFLSSVIKFDNK